MSKAAKNFMTKINETHRSVTPDALNEKAMEHLRDGSHFWVILATHMISEDALKQIEKKQTLGILDHESLIAINLGCFLCETAYVPRLMGTQCQPK